MAIADKSTGRLASAIPIRDLRFEESARRRGVQVKMIENGGAPLWTASSPTLDGQTSGGGDVLLIMGATASSAWWPAALIEALAASGRRVIVFDSRDTGGSARTVEGPPPYGPPAYDFADLADDALAVLDGYAVAAAHVVGMSMGGLIGQILAARNADRVVTLSTLCAPFFGTLAAPPPPPPMDVLTHMGGLSGVDWRDEAAVVDFIAEAWRLNGGGGRPFEPERVRDAALQEYRRQSGPGSQFNHIGLSGAEAWFDKPEAIAAPTLIVYGGGDALVPPVHAESFAARVRDGRRLLLEGAGHDLHSRDVPAIATALLAHFGDRG